MLNTLNEWSTRCVTTLADLERQIAGIKATARQRAKEEEEWAAHVEKLVEAKGTDTKSDKGKEAEDKSSGGGGLFAGLGRKLGAGAASKRGSGDRDEEEDEAMDVDDSDEKGKPNAKKRGFGLLGGGSSK